jgi:hypothetical protein
MKARAPRKSAIQFGSSTKKLLADMERRARRRTTATRQDLVKRHTDLRLRAGAILDKKNADYGELTDALANFRLASIAGVSAPQAVFARLMDKIHRLARCASGRGVRRRDDDVLDAINLLVILDVALRERKRR